MPQEKLNEAVMVLNKNLQAGGSDIISATINTDACLGGQHSKHECGAGRADVQELSIQRSLPP